MVPPHFCLQKEKVDFKEKYPFEQCLTKDQTKHIYDKIETGEEIRIKKIGFSRIIPRLIKAGDICKQ